MLVAFRLLSEGQVARISAGGDLHDLMDFSKHSLEQLVDLESGKCAIRQRGGGRACSVFLGPSTYRFDDILNASACLLDVKVRHSMKG